MTFAVIVQARMNSTRAPGKVLARLGAKSALLRCLDRCAAIPGVDAVVCAVPDTLDDDVIAAEAARGGFFVVRGSETDLLARYAKAARAVDADVVMRVTSDCPFIDPEICGQVRDLRLAAGADYAANNLPPSWPHGLDADVFPAALLMRAEHEAKDPYDREHVTPWMRRHEGVRRANLDGPGGWAARLRWTLDWPEDIAFALAVFERLGEAAATVGWETIADLCATDPKLTAINAHRVDEARLAGVAPSVLSDEAA